MGTIKYLRSSGLFMIISLVLLTSCNSSKGDKTDKSNSVKVGLNNDSITEIKMFYDNGKLKARTEIKNDVKHGMQVFYSEKGVITFRGQYRYGRKDGKHLIYNTDGELLIEKFYSNGKEDSVWTYYFKGNIDKRLFYENGKLINKKKYD